MTDFRALCAELRDELEQYLDGYLEADAPDENTAETEQLLNRALAALAQPKPQGPTDEELLKLAKENNWNHVSPETFLDIARTVIGFSAQ